MALAEEIAFVGSLLDRYAESAHKVHVAAEEPDDDGVPPTMQAGPVDDEGWVEWRLLPSTLNESDVANLEGDFGIDLPQLFRAYLLARFQLFNQVKSRRHDQLILMPDTPAHRPLAALQELLNAWRPLIDAGYIPFAQWGDGWGPMCFDAMARKPDGDCPVIWIDHELLVPLGESACRRRDDVQPLAKPVSGSFREMLLDVFGKAGEA